MVVAPMNRCSECGRFVSIKEVVRLNERPICSSCFDRQLSLWLSAVGLALPGTVGKTDHQQRQDR